MKNKSDKQIAFTLLLLNPVIMAIGFIGGYFSGHVHWWYMMPYYIGAVVPTIGIPLMILLKS